MLVTSSILSLSSVMSLSTESTEPFSTLKTCICCTETMQEKTKYRHECTWMNSCRMEECSIAKDVKKNVWSKVFPSLQQWPHKCMTYLKTCFKMYGCREKEQISAEMSTQDINGDANREMVLLRYSACFDSLQPHLSWWWTNCQHGGVTYFFANRFSEAPNPLLAK